MDDSSLNIQSINSEILQKLQKNNDKDKKLIQKQMSKLRDRAQDKSNVYGRCDCIKNANTVRNSICRIESLFIFDVDDTLSPTTSIISRLYEETRDEKGDEISLSKDDDMILNQIDDKVVELLTHIKGFEPDTCDDDLSVHDYTSAFTIADSKCYDSCDILNEYQLNDIQLSNKIMLVTAAGEDGFLAVCRHLPRFKKFLTENQIKVWINECIDAEDSIGKFIYKRTVFEHEIFKALIREQTNRLGNEPDLLDIPNIIKDAGNQCNQTDVSKNTSYDATKEEVLTSLLLISIGDGTCEQDAAFASTSTLLDLLYNKKKSKDTNKRGSNKNESHNEGKSGLSFEIYNQLFIGSSVIKLREEVDLGPENILVQLQNLKALLSSSLREGVDSKFNIKNKCSLELIIDPYRVMNSFKILEPNTHQCKNSNLSIDKDAFDLSGSISAMVNQRRFPGFYRSVPPDMDDHLLDNFMREYVQVFVAEYDVNRV